LAGDLRYIWRESDVIGVVISLYGLLGAAGRSDRMSAVGVNVIRYSAVTTHEVSSRWLMLFAFNGILEELGTAAFVACSFVIR
jgi:hypothetical protein